jgi:hypothetical protein
MTGPEHEPDIPKSKSWLSLGRLALILLPLAFVGFVVWLSSSGYAPPPFTIKTLDCGNGRSIIIHIGRALESYGYYPVSYEVRVHDTVVVPEKAVTGVWPGTSFDFELLLAENGDLAGVVLRPLAHIIERMPDFKSGDSWTREVMADSLIIIHDFKVDQSFDGIGVRFNAAASERVKRLLAAHPEWVDDTANADILKGVVQLEVDSDKRLGGADLSKVALLPALNCVVAHEPLSADGVKALDGIPTLKYLSFFEASIVDEDVLRLRGLHHLENIVVPMTGPSKEAVDALRNALPHTRIVQQDCD